MAATALVSGTLITGLAGTAHAATTPPSSPSPQPRPQEAGGLHLLQLFRAGDHRREHHQQSDRRLHPGEHRPAAHPHPGESERLRPDHQRGAGHRRRVPGAEWGLGSSNLPSSAPGALGTSALPVYTGQSYSLVPADRIVAQHRHLVDRRLRRHLRAAAHDLPEVRQWQFDQATTRPTSRSTRAPGPGSVVYTPLATTTTTVSVSPSSPASPQAFGTSVTLDALVTDASAPGTAQFESGGAAVGTPQPVVQRHGLAHDHRAAGRHRRPLRCLHTDHGCGVLRIDQHQPRLVRDPPRLRPGPHQHGAQLHLTGKRVFARFSVSDRDRHCPPRRRSPRVPDRSRSTTSDRPLRPRPFSSAAFSGASLLATAQLGSGGTATLTPVAHLHECRDALSGGAVHAGEPRRGVPDVHGLELGAGTGAVTVNADSADESTEHRGGHPDRNPFAHHAVQHGQPVQPRDGNPRSDQARTSLPRGASEPPSATTRRIP